MDAPEKRLSYVTTSLMLGTALFYDVFQALITLIPFVGTVLAYGIVGLSFLTFFVWFKIHDVGFLERFGAKKIMAYIVVPVIEVATLGIAPGITIATAITISIVKFEDKLMAEKIISREDLRSLENMVLSIGTKKGFDSPEFRHALSGALGQKIEDRYKLNERAETVSRKYDRGKRVFADKYSRVANLTTQNNIPRTLEDEHERKV